MFTALIFSTFFAMAQNASDSVAEIVVTDGQKTRGLKNHEIRRIETIKPKRLEIKQAQTFSAAIDDERGIDTQSACAFCGAKRVTINGMRGEHTTILIDGLPLHSTVSSFYGVDAIPLTGIDAIEVFRGSGTALGAPESIGGAINILTKDIQKSQVEANMSLAQDGQQNFNALATAKPGTSHGLMLTAQQGHITPVDLDRNNVAELPRQTTRSAMAKWNFRPNGASDTSVRLSWADLDTIGGTTTRTRLDQPVSDLATADDFIEKDVRRPFIGDIRKLADNVRLARYETALIHRHQLSDNTQLKFSLGGAYQQQNAIYNHGYDYDNLDRLYVALGELNHVVNDRHVLKFGFDHKGQTMRSNSRELYEVKGLKRDDINYRNFGVYLQDTWTINDDNEVALVARVDNVRTVWPDLNRQLEQTIFAPRIYFKHTHNPIFTSRVAYGLGYRAPLTLFESQHGLDHNGFVLDIHKFEKAHSLVYTLNGQRMDDFFEFNAHVTRIENMAYGLDRVNLSLPTLFRNSDIPYTITVLDVGYGRRLKPWWTLEGVLESFSYPDGYKEKLVVAAIESRASLLSNMQWGAWQATQRLNVVGGRNLAPYRYDKHYNMAYEDQQIGSPTFGQLVTGDRKGQRAPTFFTFDINVQREINKNLQLGFAVLNVFDYTQTRAGDSPTMWHVHGQHTHLDNLHIWGPLRGRQFFVSFKGTF